MDDYLTVLISMRDEMQLRVNALTRAIEDIQREYKKDKVQEFKGETDKGLAFKISSKTIPEIIPEKEEEKIEDNFDVSSIPNLNCGILDIGGA